MTNAVVAATIAVIPGIVLIVALLISERNLRKKNANQQISLIDYGRRIKDLEYEVWALNQCVATKEWRYGAYVGSSIVNGGALLSGFRCHRCHMPVYDRELVCSRCGATTINTYIARLWDVVK